MHKRDRRLCEQCSVGVGGVGVGGVAMRQVGLLLHSSCGSQGSVLSSGNLSVRSVACFPSLQNMPCVPVGSASRVYSCFMLSFPEKDKRIHRNSEWDKVANEWING